MKIKMGLERRIRELQNKLADDALSNERRTEIENELEELNQIVEARAQKIRTEIMGSGKLWMTVPVEISSDDFNQAKFYWHEARCRNMKEALCLLIDYETVVNGPKPQHNPFPDLIENDPHQGKSTMGNDDAFRGAIDECVDGGARCGHGKMLEVENISFQRFFNKLQRYLKMKRSGRLPIQETAVSNRLETLSAKLIGVLQELYELDLISKISYCRGFAVITESPAMVEFVKSYDITRINIQNYEYFSGRYEELLAHVKTQAEERMYELAFERHRKLVKESQENGRKILIDKIKRYKDDYIRNHQYEYTMESGLWITLTFSNPDKDSGLERILLAILADKASKGEDFNF